MLQAKMRWLGFAEVIEDELKQSREDAKPVDEQKVRDILSMADGPDRERAAAEWMRATQQMPLPAAIAGIEPETYEAIMASLPPESDETFPVAAMDLTARLHAAWAGRMAGCLLGIPVEGWNSGKIRAFAEETRQDPRSGYFTSSVGAALREKYGVRDDDPATPYDRQKVCWIGNMRMFPVDDDTNYTVAALRLLERFGAGFTAEQAAENLLYGIPALHVCTAERLAYRNLMNMVGVPACATRDNPYREWIGAQIRADFFGYINPGQPKRAAAMAYRDASVTHVRNGIYAEMFTAALVSLAPCGLSGLTMVRCAARQIPPKSRLAHKLATLIAELERGAAFEQLERGIHAEYDEDQWFWWGHAIPNALIVAAIVASFDGDHAEAIARAVLTGFDTDCNAATVGSIVAFRTGRVEAHWLGHFEPVLQTSVHGYERMHLDELARRTAALIKK